MHYMRFVLIAVDQLFNALLGGYADETFSSRIYRGAVLAQKPKLRWRIARHIVNRLFFLAGRPLSRCISNGAVAQSLTRLIQR